ncbi:hypothetical protein HY386_02760 [Candidatus Daviesbacteria bacterium]|nr:hypothetical protein [Candidatus Daviesbacteria bacterium]
MTAEIKVVRAACDLKYEGKKHRSTVLFGTEGVVVRVSEVLQSVWGPDAIFVQWPGMERPVPISSFEKGDKVAMPGQNLIELVKERMRTKKKWVYDRPYRRTEQGEECYLCGSAVKEIELTHSVWWPEMRCGGGGEVTHERVSYCPSCEDPKDPRNSYLRNGIVYSAPPA